MRVGAQPQPVEEAFAGARRQNSHECIRGPGDRDHTERNEPRVDQVLLVTWGNAAVHGGAHDGGEGQVRQHAHNQQGDGACDEPAHGLEHVADVEFARRGAQAGQCLLGQIWQFARFREALHTREQFRGGVDGGGAPARRHDHAFLGFGVHFGPQVANLLVQRFGLGIHGGAILVGCHDLVAGPLLDDDPTAHHRYPIRMIHRGLAVRHGQHRNITQCVAQVSQDVGFVDGVDGAGGVVKHEHLRF